MLPALTFSVSINRPAIEVYAFLADPNNWPQWANGLASGIRQANGVWYVQSPSGELAVDFSPRNDYGVLDHTVIPPGQAPVHVPMRVIANADSAEVLITLFRQPGMTNEIWQRDQNWVRKDLTQLQAVLTR